MIDPDRKWRFVFVQCLTLGRIPLIMVFLVVSILADKPLSDLWFSVAFWAMVLSAVSDIFDGYFARKFKVTSRLGAYADPLTDKIFYLTALPALIYLAGMAEHCGHAQLLLGMTVLFLMRDQWVSFLRSIGALYNVDSKANWSGKARTIISFPTICTVYYVLCVPPDWWLQIPVGIAYGLEILSIAINLISIWVYTAYYWPYLKKEIKIDE